jgi:hypothetical protein
LPPWVELGSIPSQPTVTSSYIPLDTLR